MPKSPHCKASRWAVEGTVGPREDNRRVERALTVEEKSGKRKKQGPVAGEQPGLVCGSWLTEGRDVSAATRSIRSTDPVQYVNRRGGSSATG